MSQRRATDPTTAPAAPPPPPSGAPRVSREPVATLPAFDPSTEPPTGTSEADLALVRGVDEASLPAAARRMEEDPVDLEPASVQLLHAPRGGGVRLGLLIGAGLGLLIDVLIYLSR